MRILIVEDSRDLAANIGEYLESRGELIDYAGDGATGLHLAATQRYDVIVLDLSLPGIGGLSVAKRLRADAESAVPIIMLTARDTERDRLVGFEVGADDYLTKPFSLPELHARLKAIVRRTSGGQRRVLHVGDLEFDTHTLIARRSGRRLELTPSGVKLLETLIRAAPGVVSRRDVEYALWGDDPPESEAALRGHIHALRAAVDQGAAVKLLHTVHGLGYRLAEDDAA
jgi:DNA-binding response OmpR family regulator